MLDAIKQALSDERFVMRSVKGVAKQAEMDENAVYIDLTAAVEAGEVVTTNVEGTTREPKFGLKSRVWDKVKAALEDERFTSRSLRGIALQAGVASSAVLTVLTEKSQTVPAEVAVSNGMYALPARDAAAEAAALDALNGDGDFEDDEPQSEGGFDSFRRNNPFLS